MTPCDVCHRDHWGTRCDGTPLMLRADWELPPEPECHCGAPMNESDIACTACRREAAAYVPMVMAGLEEMWWRRVNHKTLGGDTLCAGGMRTGHGFAHVTKPVVPTTVAGAGPREPASIYSIVAPGTLAALGLALGSLAHLAAMLTVAP